MIYTNAELCLIWLDSFVEFSNAQKQCLYKIIKGKVDICKILEENKEYILSKIDINQYNAVKNSANKGSLDKIIKELNDRGIKAVTIESQSYPENLKNIDVPPLVLYCKGNEKLLNGELFSIVGSRKNIPLSLKLAEDYTATVSEMGFTIVTGNADGIEQAVLGSAVKNNFPVISVIAGGIDCVNKTFNAAFMHKMAEIGLIVGEYPPSVPSLAFHFPVRNRIIAGLSKGTLIISGGIKSGTHHTAEYAESYGRDLFAVPYSSDISSGAGCNELIKRGAHLTDTPNDLLEFYGKEKSKKTVSITEEEKQILSLMQNGAVHIDKICAELNKEVFQITPLLTILEIKGLIYKSATNTYGLVYSNLEG